VITASWAAWVTGACLPSTNPVISGTEYNPNPNQWGIGGGGTCCASPVTTATYPTKDGGQTASNPKNTVDTYCNSVRSVNYQTTCDSVEIASFDMETQWGDSKNFKIKETPFERKSMIFTLDIYYASRESLVAMGVDVSNEKRVSFPESFKIKYAKPPKGWIK
jgi:hypothetical protein